MFGRTSVPSSDLRVISESYRILVPILSMTRASFHQNTGELQRGQCHSQLASNVTLNPESRNITVVFFDVARLRVKFSTRAGSELQQKGLTDLGITGSKKRYTLAEHPNHEIRRNSYCTRKTCHHFVIIDRT